MTDETKIRTAWEDYAGPYAGGDGIHQYSRGYRDGYEAARADASAELAMARKALARCEDWRERYLSNPLDGHQPIYYGQKAVPPGEE